MKVKAFTIAEIIINLAIMMTVIAVCGSMIISGMNIFVFHTEKLQQKNIADAVMNRISDEFIYAEEITSEKNNDEKIYTEISVSENGHLLINGDDIFHDEFYNGMMISYSAEINNGSVSVETDILDENGSVLYTEKNRIILLNNPVSDIISIENYCLVSHRTE